MIPLDAARPAEAGAKAAGLAALRRAGLPAPDGFVILPAAAARAARPAGDAGRRALAVAVAAALARLGAARVAVRSSATVEDRPGRSAAGLFHTTLDVPATAAAVLRAAAACVASLRAPHVAAYLGPRRRGARMAVLVLPMVEGRRGVLFTRDPDDPARLRVELERPGRTPQAHALARGGAITDPALAALVRAALAAERAFGRALDVEFALGPRGPVLLQARPAPRPRPRRRLRGLPPAARGLDLVLDREHNPAPLSPAHASLIARLDRLALPAARQVVVGGYLYAAVGPAAEAAAPALGPLWRRLRRDWERAHAAAAAAPPPPVATAVAAFERFYAAYAGLLGPALRRARAAASDALGPALAQAVAAGVRTETTRRDEALWRLARLPAARRAAALRRLLARYGAFAAAWDVAAPTWAEDPAPLREAAAALAVAPRGPEERRRAAAAAAARRVAAAPPAARRAAALARAAAAVAEDDDVAFARALAALRRALLARGRRLAAAGRLARPDDVFLLPLELPRGDLRRAVARARAALARQRRARPPARILHGVPQWLEPAGAAALRGLGGGGRGRGPAHRLASGAPTRVPPGAVLVCRTFLPSWSFVLPRLAGLVAEEGGALSHGAILAREYGVPAVFGVRGALGRVREGEVLCVDGEGGRVYPVRSRGTRPSSSSPGGGASSGGSTA